MPEIIKEIPYVWKNRIIALEARFSSEGGLLIPMINKTGLASVKGTVVKASTTTDNAFTVQAVQYDNIGIVYDDGIADGSECYVVVAGIADVLLENSTAATRGNWVYASTVDGRANATLTQPPGGGIPEIDEHFKEIGHCIESANAGTNVTCKCVLHFN